MEMPTSTLTLLYLYQALLNIVFFVPILLFCSADAYDRAIAALRAYPTQITLSTPVSEISHIGPKLTLQIETYLTTGRIPEATLFHSIEKYRVIALFMKVWGVGVVGAREWFEKGWRNLEDIKRNERAAGVTTSQKEWLARADDMMER